VIRCPTLQVSQFLFPGQRSDTFLTDHVYIYIHMHICYHMSLNYVISDSTYVQIILDKWVPVTTARRVLRLRMEERPTVWR